MKKRDKYLASFRKLLKKKIKFDMRWEDAKILIDDYDIYHKLTRKDRVLTFVEHLDSLATKKSNGLNKANDLASDEDGAFEEDYAYVSKNFILLKIVVTDYDFEFYDRRKDLKIVEVATKRKMTARSFSRSSSRSPSSERNKRRNRGYHL